MKSKKQLPRVGRPAKMPDLEKLASIRQFQPLVKKAMLILKRYPCTRNWGERELSVIFGWMKIPFRLDDSSAMDSETRESMHQDQIVFARLFSSGPEVFEPIQKLVTIFKTANRNKTLRSAMRYGERNQMLKAWNRAREKSGLPKINLSHLTQPWEDKADALASSKCTARDVENLRATLRSIT